MGATDKNLSELIDQHRAIRAQMRFIIESLKGVEMQPDQETEPLIQLSELMKRCLWPLYDFREIIQRHVALDEGIFEQSGNITSTKEISAEHDEIRRQADNAIQLAENAVYKNLSREELNQSAIEIREMFARIHEIIEEHMDKEDRLLELARKVR